MTESASNKDQRPYERFTLKMAVELAAPHTWPASILPVLVATSCAIVHSPALDVLMVCALLAICILMQASVNTFNDYYDFVKGADSEEDNVDATDAVLVYNHINPASALRLAVGLLVAAFAIGVYVIYCAGWIPLVLGIIGAVIVVAYSAGKTPISYLPIGEVVSGFVMGGLIPLACYQVLTGDLDFVVLVWSIPTIIGVSRRTLPTLLGWPHARKLYHALVFCWLVAIAVIIAVFFTRGTIVLVFALLASYPLLKALLSNPLAPQARIGAMAQICSVNIALGSFYAAAILASSAIAFIA